MTDSGSDLKMANRVLVTGAAGFVGQYVLRALLANGFKKEEVFAGIFGSVNNIDPDIHSLRLDITNSESVDLAIQEIKPTAIIHLAAVALPSTANSNPELAWKVNFHGTLNLAQAIMKYTPSARLVFSASAEVYGNSFRDFGSPLNETARLWPTSPYGATKAAADITLRQMACAGLDVVCFRPFNHTGPGRPDHYVASSFAKQFAEIMQDQRPLLVKVGNLDVERDFLDVRDVAEAYALALKVPAFAMEDRALNLSSGSAIKIRCLLGILLKFSEKDVKIVVDPEKVRENEVQTISGDSSRARVLLGWQPKVSLEQTLRDILEYWLVESKMPKHEVEH